MGYFNKKLALILEDCSALLLEGWGYQLKDPNFTITKGDNKNTIREKGQFTFRDPTVGPYNSENEYDFVKIVPANEHKSFRIKSDPKSLSTFVDVEIWYGYDIESPEEFSLDDENNDWDEEHSRILDLYHEITETNYPYDSGSIRIRQGKNTIDDLWNFHAAWRRHPHTETGRKITDSVEELIKIMGKYEKPTVSSLLKIFKSKVTKRSKIHLGKIKWTFADLLKHPRDGKEEKIKNTFVKLGSELFRTKIKDEDYVAVLYPQSSSQFNEDFANAIAELLEIPFTLQLQKTIFGRDVALEDIPIEELVNMPELEIAGEFLQKKRREEMDGHGKLQDIEHIKVLDTRWPKAWADKEARKLKKAMTIDKNGNIVVHALASKDKRRYARIFSDAYIDSDGNKESLSNIGEGAHILIIDDNVDSQGTLESIRDMIAGIGPASVDIYVPLNLN